MVEMVPVDSSSLKAVGYDAKTASLYATFLESGETYVYFMVRQGLFEDLLTAESKGAFFNQHIRNAHRFLKL